MALAARQFFTVLHASVAPASNSAAACTSRGRIGWFAVARTRMIVSRAKPWRLPSGRAWHELPGVVTEAFGEERPTEKGQVGVEGWKMPLYRRGPVR